MVYYHWVINMSKNICQFCGETIDKNDIFCKGCGAKVEKNEEIKDAVIINDNTSKKDTLFLLVFVLFLLLIIAITTGLIILFK